MLQVAGVCIFFSSLLVDREIRLGNVGTSNYYIIIIEGTDLARVPEQIKLILTISWVEVTRFTMRSGCNLFLHPFIVNNHQEHDHLPLPYPHANNPIPPTPRTPSPYSTDPPPNETPPSRLARLRARGRGEEGER